MGTKRQSVEIAVDDTVRLEGVFIGHSRKQGGILCHPHPLHGGSMNNNVLFAAEQALNEMEISTLRFNFRGVGRSTGRHGGGREEAIDVKAACDFLRKRNPGTKIHVIAYSFGSFAFLHAVSVNLRVDTCVLVAPPLLAMDFSNLVLPEIPTAIVVGDRDEYCPLDHLSSWIDRQIGSDTVPDFQQTILSDTNHFFMGKEDALMDAIRTFYHAS